MRRGIAVTERRQAEANDEGRRCLEPSERARRLHHDSIVIDGHSDILLPVVAAGRRSPNRSRNRARTLEGRRASDAPAAQFERPAVGLRPIGLLIAPAGQYELPLLEQGGITAQCVAVFMHEEHDRPPARDRAGDGRDHPPRGRRALGSLPAGASVADIRRAKSEGKVSYILTFEGAEPIGPHRPAGISSSGWACG